VAISITIDPADRAFYVGYESGNVQRIDFYETISAQHPLYDQRLQNTPSQISVEQQWPIPSADKGAATALALSYDGMTLYSGHPNGSVLAWDVARKKFSSTIADYMSPVTNLHMLLPTGFASQDDPHFTIPNIVKPRYEQNISDKPFGDGTIPYNYSLIVQLTPATEGNESDIFSEALTHPVFPTSLLEEGLAELAALNQGHEIHSKDTAPTPTAVNSAQLTALEDEITHLKKQLSINEAARRADADEVVKLKSNIRELQDSNSKLQTLQAQLGHYKALAHAEKDDRDFERRKAWFEAEKAGTRGDVALRKARAQDEHDDNDDEMSE
jgi:pre-rRNA-processing protein IPI3